MMVTTPPSCLRPPPDPPPTPSSFLSLMQHCSSSLKMMVTALPHPSEPWPPDPPPHKHFPVTTLSPVKRPPPDPPDTSISLVLLRIFVASSRSSLQATQILDMMFNLSRVSSMLRDGDAALVVTGDNILVYWCSFPVVYRLSLCQCSFPVLYRLFLGQLQNESFHSSYSSLYSLEWDAMLDGWVIRALVGNVLLDSRSFGYVVMSLGCFYSAIECLLSIDFWFQICLTSFRVEDCSTDDSFSVLFKGSDIWCHIASAIPSFVEIRGRLGNGDAAWNAKSRRCNNGRIFSGEDTVTLPNLCESRNYVLSALMAEAVAVYLAVATAVYSSIRFLAVLFDSLSLIKLLKNDESQLELFGIMFDIYHYLFYFDVISCTFIFQNSIGEVDVVAKSALSLIVTIPLRV